MSREEDEQMDYRNRRNLGGCTATSTGKPNVVLHGYQGDIPPQKSIKIYSTNDSEVWEVRIRLINAVAGLLAAAGVCAIGLAVVWLVRGA
jgi:hypothetical protein